MRRYAAGDGCLMAFLQTALDDPDPRPCGRCSVCTGQLPHPGQRPSEASLLAARAFARGVDVVIEPRKMWPSGLEGRKGKIVGCELGRALAFADDPGWADEVRQLQSGDAPIQPAVADGLVEVLRRWKQQWSERPVAVVPVPSRSHPQRVASIAQHIATVGRLPIIDAFQTSGGAPPDDAASGARVRALLAGLRLRDDVQLPAGAGAAGRRHLSHRLDRHGGRRVAAQARRDCRAAAGGPPAAVRRPARTGSDQRALVDAGGHHVVDGRVGATRSQRPVVDPDDGADDQQQTGREREPGDVADRSRQTGDVGAVRQPVQGARQHHDDGSDDAWCGAGARTTSHPAHRPARSAPVSRSNDRSSADPTRPNVAIATANMVGRVHDERPARTARPPSRPTSNMVIR